MNCSFCRNLIRTEGSSALAYLADNEGYKHALCKQCATKILNEKVAGKRSKKQKIKVKEEVVDMTRGDVIDLTDENEYTGFNEVSIGTHAGTVATENDGAKIKSEDNNSGSEKGDNEPNPNEEDTEPLTQMNQEDIDAAKKEKGRKYGDRVLLGRQQSGMLKPVGGIKPRRCGGGKKKM
jgi:hypothetical protein